MFEGFQQDQINVGEASVFVRHGGDGPPVVLLHGQRTATRNPDVVRAMLEDYRAGLTVDRRHEEADRAAGNRLRSPLLVLWSQRDDLEDLYGDPLVIWRDWAGDGRLHRSGAARRRASRGPGPLPAAPRPVPARAHLTAAGRPPLARTPG